MNHLPEARVKRISRFSLIWIIPLLCLVMLGFLAYRRFQSVGPLIAIRFDDADSIVPDKTEIKYLGVAVGVVTEVAIDSGTVAVTARLDRTAAGLARTGTVFVMVKPEVGFQGVAGLSTIFGGSSIDLRPGHGEPASRFKGYGDFESLVRDEPGLVINLTARRSSSLHPGDPVTYRGIKVGAVTQTELTQAGDGVLIRIKIENRYDRFIKTNTKFWDASGLHAKLGLFGGNISIDSLQALLKGGVSFATPGVPGERARPGAVYVLYPQAQAVWEK